MRAGGVALKDPDSGTSITIGDISTGFSITGLRDGRSRVALTYRHGGFTITPNPAGSEFTPETFDLSLELADLPNAGLWQALTDFIESSALQQDGNAQNEAGAQVFDLLAKAGSRLEIARFLFKTPALDGTLQGSLKLDAKAMNSAVGEGNIMLRGLDGTVKKLTESPRSPETEEALGILNMLQLLGQIAKDEKGRETRTYALKLQPDGKVLLNGADMSMMLGGGAPR
jgi:hypothetical protein